MIVQYNAEFCWRDFMSDTQTKAILVVSFGTSFPDTRKRTITAIEDDGSLTVLYFKITLQAL